MRFETKALRNSCFYGRHMNPFYLFIYVYMGRYSHQFGHCTSCFVVRNPCIKPLTIEEQCGINLTFPGTTEYTDRYVAPPRDRPTKDFIINPVADYRIDGRPMARQRYLCPETEYEVRYEWPDGERIMKFPWLRK